MKQIKKIIEIQKQIESHSMNIAKAKLEIENLKKSSP